MTSIDTTGTLPVIPKRQRVTGNQRVTLRARMVTAYAAGRAIRDIADETGRSYGFVHRVLVESGTALRSRGGHHRLDQQ